MSRRNKSLPPLDREVLNLREAADSLDRYADGLVSDVARFEAMAERNAATNPAWADRCRLDAKVNRKVMAGYRAEAVAKRAEAALLAAEPMRAVAA